MSSFEAISAALGVVTLAFAILAWLAARRANRLATERADVRWEVYPDSRGTFDVTNMGDDDAHEVAVEMWDGHDLATEQAALIKATDGVRLTLPTRERVGPEPTGIPDRLAPEPPDPARIPEVLRPKLAPQLELTRRIWEQGARQHADLVRQAEAQQVAVRVVWRTKLGRWASWEGTTG